MPTLQEIEEYRPKPTVSPNYQGTTHYNVNGIDYECNPTNHPASLANFILQQLKFKHYAGAQIIGGMGAGKTSFVQCVCFQLRKKAPEYQVIWAEAEQWTDLKAYLETLPKGVPLILVLDDTTGSSRAIARQKMEENFNALTRIRWILDPVKGEANCIVMAITHYGLSEAKQIRSVLPICCMLEISLEERTNLDRIAPKGTIARRILDRYIKISDRMYLDEEFYLLTMDEERKLYYKTDNPMRIAAVITGQDARIILFSKDDTDEQSRKKHVGKTVSGQEFYDIVKRNHKYTGIKALSITMAKRGYTQALPSSVESVCQSLERNYFSKYNTDYSQVVEAIRKDQKKGKPKRPYRHHDIEDNVVKELDKISIIKEIEQVQTPENNEPVQ